MCLALTWFIISNPIARAQQPAPPASAQATPPATSSPAPDRIQQMRTDLDQMESQMNSMSSRVNFLRDQNLQILLNNNVRLWTILIRDLRLQLDEEQHKRDAESKPREPKSAKP
jgi:small-conductance mechanosensitive channel